jgi:hypothetical protein
MSRLAEQILPFGFKVARRRAGWPARRSSSAVNAATDRLPAAPLRWGWPSANRPGRRDHGAAPSSRLVAAGGRD